MNILCLPYSHTLSHLGRPLTVALELRRRGHQVAFAGESPRLGHAAKAGFAIHALHEPDPETLYGNIREGRLRFVSTRELERMIEADLELFRRVRPEVILTDGRFSAGISAQLARLPHAAIVNVSSTRYRALPYVPMFDFLPRGRRPGPGTAGSFLDRLNLRLEMAIFDAAMPDFSRLSRKYALAKRVTATDCLAGADLTLLSDIPEYFPTRDLPPDHRYVGPLAWDLPMTTPDWWPPATDGGLFVYATMGTTGVPGLFPRLLESLDGLGAQAIVTTGGQAKGLEAPSPAVRIEEFVDGRLVLPLCDVVVCHGGNGTIYQALQQGKPVIGLPTIPDQAFNMRRVEALGAGLTVRPKDFLRHPKILDEALRLVATRPAFREAASRLGRIIDTYHPASASADHIEGLARATAGGPPNA
jgi:UDP:flavonoid glycosyltransferase YjiC (YdhE family)